MEFVHKPIMLNECLDGLNIKKTGIYFDGTLGGAGHSSEILKRLSGSGLLVATDKDNDAIKVSTERLSKISSNFKIVKSDFKDYKNVIHQLNIKNVDGILLDLGVSSYQLDEPERGFSYRYDSKLDMRMDRDSTLTAEYIVNNYSEKDLLRVLYDYGEEPFSKSIVKKILEVKTIKRIETTGELVDIIKECVPKKVQITKGHPAKRVFQALRIEVNSELTNLEDAIYDMVESLNVGGRIAIITFHSLEDRIVKNAFKLLCTDCICDKNIPFCVCHHKATGKLITKKPIEPSQQELAENPRSASSKLRILERI